MSRPPSIRQVPLLVPDHDSGAGIPDLYPADARPPGGKSSDAQADAEADRVLGEVRLQAGAAGGAASARLVPVAAATQNTLGAPFRPGGIDTVVRQVVALVPVGTPL